MAILFQIFILYLSCSPLDLVLHPLTFLFIVVLLKTWPLEGFLCLCPLALQKPYTFLFIISFFITWSLMGHLCICPFTLQNLPPPLMHFCSSLSSSWELSTSWILYVFIFLFFRTPPTLSTHSYFLLSFWKPNPSRVFHFSMLLLYKTPLHIITHHSLLRNLTPCMFLLFSSFCSYNPC
jgi:hypothetical protein